MHRLSIALLALSLDAWTALHAEPVGTAFNFQGQLDQAGAAAEGLFDFRFDVYNVAALGSPLASTVELEDVPVSAGAFAVSLDFGPAVFTNQKVWLEIAVRDGTSSGAFTTLAPRQAVAPTPYSIQAQSVPDGSISAAKIDTATVQKRVTGSCAAGEVLRAINPDGSVNCEPLDAGGCSLSACTQPGSPGFATLTCRDASIVVSCQVPGAFWVGQTAAEANSWRAVTHGAGTFVAVANDGTHRVMTSPDGVSWTARSAAETNNWYAVTYGGGQFVAVAGSGTNRVMTSPNGVNWTPRSAPPATWNAVTHGGGVYAAVGSSAVMTSPDGVSWTDHAPATNSFWRSVTYGAGLFVAVSADGVMTSPDGISWTSRAAAAASAWSSVVFADGLFVAVAQSGSTRIMTSANGINWTARSAPTIGSWTSVTHGDSHFIAVASPGSEVISSPNGIDWFAHQAALNNTWSSVAYGDGRFVAVADGGSVRVMTSTMD